MEKQIISAFERIIKCLKLGVTNLGGLGKPNFLVLFLSITIADSQGGKKQVFFCDLNQVQPL